MKYLFHPWSLLFITVFGSMLFVGITHNHYHETYEADVHGYVKQYCRRNQESCQDILDSL